MAITGRAPVECFRRFQEVVQQLISQTVSDRAYVGVIQGGSNRASLHFQQGRDAVGVPVQTHLGRLYLYIFQHLGVEPEGEHFRLTTRQYAYRIQEGPSWTEDRALIRWEFAPESAGDRPWHHVQIPVRVTSPHVGEVDLQKVHLPTGRVTIEEVVRFLITDLGAEPPCGPDAWRDVLAESERLFYEDFTSPRAPRTP